ncbi:hypothetical protein N431DRAFT_494813 [Stipitochalara longipes BDJ]|nr:hypothetical protein N431DRAFT_494813 [Stipitochalara longipes BDJ]
MVPEGSMWSFGGLPEAVERNLNTPPARPKEMIKQSPQAHIPKQEYFTPRQHLMRGQHGTPITISSGGSYIQDEYVSTRPMLKRAGSPSVMHGIPAKRQQMVYTSPGMMDPPSPIPEDARQFLLEEQVQDFENQYVDEQQMYQQQVPVRLSQSPYEQAPQGRNTHGCPTQHIPQDRNPFFREQLASRFPGALKNHSPQYSSAEPHPLAKMMISDENRDYIRATSRHYQLNHNNVAEQNAQENLGQATAVGLQGRLQLQNEDYTRLGNVAHESPAGKIQQRQLGSPLWPNANASRKDARDSPIEIRVRGRNVVPAGSVPIPEDQIDHRQLSENPFTPPQQRAKTPTTSSYRLLATQRGRSKSVAPTSIAHEVPQLLSQRVQRPYQPPSVEDASEDDESESTPLNEVLRRQQLQGQMPRNNFEEGSYKVANVLPQDSIFSHDRPKPVENKSAVSQGPFGIASQRSPEMVSLLSTPEGGEAASPLAAMRSVPMKERIAPAKKPPSKKSAATPKSAARPTKSMPKTPKAAKKQVAKKDAEQPPDPELVMQQRAAELIVTKEIQGADEAMDLDLFGEILGITEGEKARKEDEMRAESQRKLLAKTAQILAKEEAKELTDMERQRIAAEKEEKYRLEKEKEEELTKARRVAERSRQEALEEKERDELRRKAAEKIEAGRRKDAEKAEQAERTKREAEKLEKVQAEAEELAKLKAKQEEARKRAASLSASKVAMPGDGDKENGGDIVIEEESLFVPETEPAPAGVKPVGPSNAAQVFAQSAPKAAISGYRAEREKAELRREKLAKESRLNARWKRQEAAQALQHAPPPNSEAVKERPGPSKASKQDRQPPKPKPRSGVSPPPSESASIAGSAVSQPIVSSFTSSAELSFGSNKSAPASLFPKDPQNSNSRVKLISDLERQRIENEQYEKQAKENALRKAARTEEQKEQRRKKDDEKAREKQKQRVIDEANKLGKELSEEDLAAEVEKYMTKRENERQRRREREAAKKNTQEFPSDNLALQALLPSQRGAVSEVAESHTSGVDDQEITLEEQVRRANAAATRESLRALAWQRNPSFARAAAKKTVADFQSDTESEEDPDPVQASQIAEEHGIEDNQSDSDDNETSDEETNTAERLNPDEQDAQIVPPLPDKTTSFKCRNDRKKQSAKMSSAAQDLLNNPDRSGHEIVMLYTVKKELTFNGKALADRDKDEKPKELILGQYFSRKQANDFAAAKVQEFRKRPTKSISEGLDDEDLYCATVIYDRAEKNQVYVYVIATPMSSGEFPDFDPSDVEYRLPEKTYILMQYISKREVDEETGEVHIHHNKPEILDQFSRVEMANHEASTRLIALLKPKSANIEHVTQHANELAPMIRQGMDAANAEKIPLELEIEKNEDQLQWLDFDFIKMEVTLLTMKGPRN